MVAPVKLWSSLLCFSFLLFAVPEPLIGRQMIGKNAMDRRNAQQTERLTNGEVSSGARKIFESFCREFESQRGNWKSAAPKRVIWLNGAPGAGKGTNAGHVAAALHIGEKPIVTSDLLDSAEFKALKDEGKLIGDEDVTVAVFRKLLDGSYRGGAIVDGFPRTAQQAECVKLLYDKILAKTGRLDFSMVLFEVSEAVSVERQLGRGRATALHNGEVRKSGNGKLVPVRKTDSDPRAARQRYKTYVEQTESAVATMKKFFPCHRIDAEGSFDQVKEAIGKTVRR
ncbi:MAG: nucleoside monophosphate kinase [Puniceicoccales bacterium]|jgi:adenylate kinase|nr:nucleoside monophosphate kinase [Puniceicoccales bacterium]